MDTIGPFLNFGLRFQAGYIFRTPLNQFSGSGHCLVVGTTIAGGAEGKAVHLIDRLKVPADAACRAGGPYFPGDLRHRCAHRRE